MINERRKKEKSISKAIIIRITIRIIIIRILIKTIMTWPWDDTEKRTPRFPAQPKKKVDE